MNKYLKDIFIHLDGVAMTPIYEFLTNKSLSNHILINDLKKGIFRIEHKKEASLNEGYWSVLAKILKAQNIVKKNSSKDSYGEYYNLTNYGKEVLLGDFNYSGIKNYYTLAINLIEKKLSITDSAFSHSFDHIYSIYLDSIKKTGVDSLISKHLEGALIAPILIYYKYTTSKDINSRTKEVQNFLEKINFLKNKELTDKGNYLLSKSYAYGVTDSYMRTFIHLEEICLNLNSKGVAYKTDKNKKELHVDRALNVWGSGHSHSTYFKHIDNYVIDIFNKPIDRQPKGIADMGCGDGAFLHHLNDLIKNKTLRGKHLNSHPLILIGADFNQAALDETHKMFTNNKNKPLTVLADISKPKEYAELVKSKYSLNIIDFLNVRSFLDHNRRFEEISPQNNSQEYDFRNVTSNAFSWRGKAISSHEIQTNLVDHFKKWKEYISKYGLLVLELHSININDIYNHIGKVPMTAYLATHGFSDQFIIEYNVYKECLEIAGLNVNEKYEKIFPNMDTKMISINLIN